MSTLSELRIKSRKEIKIDPNGKIWGDAEMNDYINDAIFQVQKDWGFKWTQNMANTSYNLTSWTRTYALPTWFISIDIVRYNWTELLMTDKKTVKRQYASFVAWTPSEFYIDWSNISYNVIPNVTWLIDFDFYKKLTVLSADTDECAFPEDYDSAIIKYVAYLAWGTSKGSEQTSQIKLQEYSKKVDSLVQTYLYNNTNLRFSTARRGGGMTRADVLDR